eukprot:RCo046943
MHSPAQRWAGHGAQHKYKGKKGEADAQSSLRVLKLRERLRGVLDDLHALHELLLVDHQRRGQPHDVPVSGLGQQASLLHQKTEVPRVFTAGPLFDHHSVEQALAPDQRDDLLAGVNLVQVLPQDDSHLFRVLGQFLFLEDLQRGKRDLARQGVPSKGGTVLARLNGEHHGVISDHGRHRQHSSRQGLAHDDNVRTHIFVVHAHHLSRAAQPSLDLIRDKEDVLLLAQLRNLLKVSRGRNVHPSFPLDGLNHHGHNVRVLSGLLHGLDVVIWNAVNALHQGAVPTVAIGVVRKGDHGNRPSVKVVLRHHNAGLIFWHFLDIVPPSTSKLESGLTRFRSGVHRENLVVAQQLGDVLFELPQNVVVESTTGQGANVCLLLQSINNFGVAMTLVNSRVGTQKVVVLVALAVPNLAALGLGDHNWKGMIVVAAVLRFELHEALRHSSQPLGASPHFGVGYCYRREMANT